MNLKKLIIVNPDETVTPEKFEVTPDWTYAELESVFLSTVSRPTSMRRFWWLVYGQRKTDESLVVTIMKSLGINGIDHMVVGDVAFDLRDLGHLTYTSRWGWRAK